ncbi:hypothetical protein D922_01267 [Enterococcus faecalis 06-MB-DW-09]|nr:hypothetical protein D922_01267 [Enterococcus faecalis 06-MB-DW-09]
MLLKVFSDLLGRKQEKRTPMNDRVIERGVLFIKQKITNSVSVF